MTVRFFFSRSIFLSALLPLVLTACVNAEPAIANPPAPPPLGVDLGGAPARRSAAVELASASPAAPPVMNHAGHEAGHSEIQMAHEGHAGAHGTGTVTVVNAAQHRVGMQHDPIPAIGWPAMSMEFAVAPSVNLQGLQPGSRVNFSIEKGPDGMYVIQSIQPAGASR